MTQWVPAVCFTKYLEVSDDGQIRSVDREVVRDGQGNFMMKGQVLKPTIDPETGYSRVAVYINGKCKNISVHRAVALAFIPLVTNKPFVNHKDGNKTHNAASNLEWESRSGNQQHALRTGLRGMKLTEEDVSDILEAYACGRYTNREIGEKHGCTGQYVGKLVRGENRTGGY